MMCRIPRIFTCCAIFTFPFGQCFRHYYTKTASASSAKAPGNRYSSALSLILEGYFRVGAEFLVIAVTDHQAHALRAGTKIQGVVGISGDRKPKIAVHLLPQRREVREQILVLQRSDLRHGFAFAADDGVIEFRNPQHAVKEPLALQDLARTNLDHITIDAVHRFFALEMCLVEENLIGGKQERLHFADVAKILVCQLKPAQTVDGLADHLLSALLLRRE